MEYQAVLSKVVRLLARDRWGSKSCCEGDTTGLAYCCKHSYVTFLRTFPNSGME